MIMYAWIYFVGTALIEYWASDTEWGFGFCVGNTLAIPLVGRIVGWW